MTRYKLVPHPDHPPLSVTGVTVEITTNDRDDILLSYAAENADRMVVPAWTSPIRADDLWRTTCFELFLRPDGGGQYYEFNFSPSTRWAAYAFDGYRAGMRPLARPVDPFIDRTANGIEVDCDLSGIPDIMCEMALTAVIEEQGGRRSFWSLAHPPGSPDFHHHACFVATLPAPGGV